MKIQKTWIPSRGSNINKWMTILVFSETCNRFSMLPVAQKVCPWDILKRKWDTNYAVINLKHCKEQVIIDPWKVLLLGSERFSMKIKKHKKNIINNIFNSVFKSIHISTIITAFFHLCFFSETFCLLSQCWLCVYPCPKFKSEYHRHCKLTQQNIKWCVSWEDEILFHRLVMPYWLCVRSWSSKVALAQLKPWTAGEWNFQKWCQIWAVLNQSGLNTDYLSWPYKWIHLKCGGKKTSRDWKTFIREID